METWIGLLDCNNFFVSCERLFRPDLKKRPVLVLSSNDGCVVARSQEIKDNGIPMGVPHFQIKDIIKDIDAVTFSSHFALYRDVSRRVFEVMRTELDTVEQYSVDEAFFLLQGEKGVVNEKVRRVKDRVEQLVGIPVSVGVASSKTLAKYAGSVAKKTNGVCVMDDVDWKGRQEQVLLRELWGVGYRSAEAYQKHGLVTAAQFLKLERRQVSELFGVAGTRLQRELQGHITETLSGRRAVQKSLLHSRSFKQTVSDESVLQDAVAYHLREAAEDLRAMGQKTSTLQVSLGTSRHGDYFLQGGSLVIDLEAPTNDTFVLLHYAKKAVTQLYRPEVPYKKAGILLTNFTPQSLEQQSLFGTPGETKTSSLMPVIDAINKRVGKGGLLLGSHLQTEKWHTAKALRSPAYTTCWDDVAIVKAG